MPVEPPIVTPRTLDDAYAVIAEAPHRPIAGGTDVMVQLTAVSYTHLTLPTILRV